MAKECMGPLVPAIRMLWETAEKTWPGSFALIVAVNRCGRFIITVVKISFILQKQRKGKKEVANWWAALNFILIDLAENHTKLLFV